MTSTFDPAALDQFLYWIRERIAIHRRREAGKPRPWSKDPIFQEWFFTNPYREWDRTTIWFRDVIRDPLSGTSDVILATIIFRWFNYIPTGKILGSIDAYTDWNYMRVLNRLREEERQGRKIFTGAYIIKAGEGLSKIKGVCDAIETIWSQRYQLASLIQDAVSLEEAWEALIQFPYLGGFMAYEIVTDLRWANILGDLSDKDTWCHPGPGAKRGMMRLLGHSITNDAKMRPALPEGWQTRFLELLEICKRHHPDFEMREVEHSLCEYDKYARITNGGRGKRRYNGNP